MALIRKILIIEDDIRTIKLMKYALKELSVDLPNLEHEIFYITDGEEALNYLLSPKQYKDYPLDKPDMIVLDLRLPTIDGLDVLKELRKNPKTAYTPVTIFTTSEQEQEIIDCYQTGANSFMVKPLDFEEFLDVIKTMIHYWLRVKKA